MSGLLRWFRTTLAALPLIVIGGARADDKGYTDDPVDQVRSKVESKKAILVDVREQKEWDRGHIRGAVLLPMSRLVDWERDGMTAEEKAGLVKSLPKGSVVYCHCAAGARALPGAEALRKLGYDARPLRSGYRALIDAGFPRAPTTESPSKSK